jgi:membrane protein YqaA with SNARE-associated domain
MFETFKEFAKNVVFEYGYVGIFLISFTESIIQPVPPDPFITGATAFGLNPLISAFVAAIASVLGGSVGYFLGKFLGEPIAKKLIKEKYYKEGEKLFNKYGIYAVLVGALTPVPYKVICWMAGIFEMNFLKFLLASFVGRFPRFFAVALLGQFIGNL